MSEYIGQFILGIMSGICPIFAGNVSPDNLARIKVKTHQIPIYILDNGSKHLKIFCRNSQDIMQEYSGNFMGYPGKYLVYILEFGGFCP